VKIEGEEELLDFLSRLDLQGLNAIREKVTARTRIWAAQARALTPDDPKTPGLLKDSVTIIRPITKDRKITGGLKAGGTLLERRIGKRGYSAWAIVQHEDLTLHHPHGGQAKFIEIPFMQGVTALPGDIWDALETIKP